MAGAPRAASRFGFSRFISITRTKAHGVTAMVVGSGALSGTWRVWIQSAVVPFEHGKILVPVEDAFDLLDQVRLPYREQRFGGSPGNPQSLQIPFFNCFLPCDRFAEAVFKPNHDLEGAVVLDVSDDIQVSDWVAVAVGEVDDAIICLHLRE